MIPHTEFYANDQYHNVYNITSQTIPTKWYVVKKRGLDMHVSDCQWEKKGNMCKHVLKILDLLKRYKINEKDKVLCMNILFHTHV